MPTRSTTRLILLGACAALCVPSVVGATPSSLLSSQKISDTAGNFLEPLGNVDEFGGAVVGLGDLDGSGPSVVALAVGAIGDDDGGTNRGAVYVLFLNAAGNVLSHQKISDTVGGFTEPLANDDEFGSAVAFLGDLDGAGPSAAALAVSASFDDDGGADRGAVYILFLNANGTVLSNQKISDTAGNFLEPLGDGDEFGSSIADMGDLDGAGAGVTALAVGTAADDDGGSDRGAVYVLFLTSTGNVLSYQKISDTAGNFLEPLSSFDAFGCAVAHLGDLDGAGLSAGALAVGATGDDDGGADRGAIYILFLSDSGSVISYQKVSDTAGNFAEPLGNLDEFGGALVGLDDADRYGPAASALAVGVTGDDDGGSGRGAAYVLYLTSAGEVLSYQKISATTGNLAGPLDDGDEFGSALGALGDLDGTGPSTQTLVVGAVGDDDGGSARGAVWVLGLDGITTSDTQAPPLTRHVLGAAKPNPFNPRTVIPFAIATDARVQIDILDVAGRHVRSLVHAAFAAGAHQAVWDGLDDRSRALASGTYLVRMSVNGQPLATTARVVLLK